MLRELILDHDRLDILGKHVLGYEMPDHIPEMIAFQDSVQEGLILAFRGARKTTWLTTTKAIHEILKDPDIRILLSSEAEGQAKVILRSIKSHFEHNEKFRAVFGDYVTKAPIWTDSEITVNKRRRHVGEPTVMCVGIGTTLPSRHFDLIICDDLVTKENSQTEGQRKKTHDYFYETLFPTLESPDGRLYIIGTRWHEEDLYGWLAKNDYKHFTCVVPVLDENDQSIWEEKFPTKRMHRIRAGNLGAFMLQFMCQTGAGGGNIFLELHFEYYDALPHDVVKWQGVDLAVRQKETSDFFAHVTLAIQKRTRIPYLISYRKTRMPFPRQPQFVADRWRENQDVRAVAVEVNQYQDALRQQVREDFPDVPIIGRWTQKDKILRGNQVAILLTDRPLRILRQHHEFKRMLRGFPGIKGSKDVFDAFELALSLGLKGKRKERKRRVGLI